MAQTEESLLIISPAITLSSLVGRMNDNEVDAVAGDGGASLPGIQRLIVIAQ